MYLYTYVGSMALWLFGFLLILLIEMRQSRSVAVGTASAKKCENTNEQKGKDYGSWVLKRLTLMAAIS